jgi:hypothetical protein
MYHSFFILSPVEGHLVVYSFVQLRIKMLAIIGSEMFPPPHHPKTYVLMSWFPACGDTGRE